MKIYQSKIYGKIPEPESFTELVDLITQIDDNKSDVYMWRGQSNIDWKMDHGAFRRLNLVKIKFLKIA